MLQEGFPENIVSKNEVNESKFTIDVVALALKFIFGVKVFKFCSVKEATDLYRFAEEFKIEKLRVCFISN